MHKHILAECNSHTHTLSLSLDRQNIQCWPYTLAGHNHSIHGITLKGLTFCLWLFLCCVLPWRHWLWQFWLCRKYCSALCDPHSYKSLTDTDSVTYFKGLHCMQHTSSTYTCMLSLFVYLRMLGLAGHIKSYHWYSYLLAIFCTDQGKCTCITNKSKVDITCIRVCTVCKCMCVCVIENGMPLWVCKFGTHFSAQSATQNGHFTFFVSIHFKSHHLLWCWWNSSCT